MKRSSLVKVITLSSFVFFIVAFLFFRSGAFDGYLYGSDPSVQTSPNGGTINTIKKDTLPAKTPPSKRAMMASSKSVIVYNGNDRNDSSGNSSAALFVVDGKTIKNTNDINPDDIDTYTILQSGEAIKQFGPAGKNGAIIMKTKRSKLLKKDTVPGNVKIDSATERMLLMSGSKSGRMFTPGQIDTILNKRTKKKKNKN